MNEKTAPVNLGVFFDTETTGIPDWKVPSHMPEQPHMTQLAALQVDMDKREILQSMNMVVRPDGWVIPQECVELNGIGDEFANAVGLPEDQVVSTFMSLLTDRDGGMIKRLAFNTTFDNRIVRIGLKRYFRSSCDQFKEGEYECVMIKSKKHLGGKNPKLEDAYREICGKEITNAHDAMADIMATMELYFAIEDATSDSSINLFS